MKNSYILLRSNKESGPFTASELQQQGLKADDLVWVEGQSVAWLRPAEIPSLRDLVNGVMPVHHTSTPVSSPVEETYDKFIPAEKATEPVPAVKPSVFVSLPQQPIKAAVSSPVFIPEEKVAEEKEIPKKKYEQPLDEIKDMYVKTLEDRKKRIATRKKNARNLKYAAVILALVLAGALLGITLQKKWNRTTDTVDPATVQQQSVVPQVPVTAVQDSVTVNTEPVNVEDVETEPAGTREPPPVVAKTEETNRPAATETDQKPAVNTPAETAVTAEKEIPRVNIDDLSSLVAVKTNDYKTGSFGGIRGLKLTVTNDSKYPLEKVIVELHYLKLGDEVVKSETVQFHSVPANGSRTLDIPASKRGIKVAWKITRIDASPKANVAGF